MTEYTPCPTCQQYSHSIGEDRVTEAFLHFQSMSAMPIQNAFDEQTRDHTQVLLAEITRLRADRNAVIRECAVAIKHAVHSAIYTVGTREGAAPCDYSEAANEAIEQSILALIEGDE